MVTFVRAERYNGSYALNPFKFDHYNANTMSILVNDVSMPHCPLDIEMYVGECHIESRHKSQLQQYILMIY